ncbi:MAG: amino acid adenylation domain-containing protein [Cypionkella sp.]|nr:amino acid adenylation domain-containing protein [Cypionkella sp.]
MVARKPRATPENAPENAPVRATASLPLTPAQIGLLYESVLADRPWINLEQIVVRLPKAPRAEALHQAWRDTATRHEALRLIFDLHAADGPTQSLLPDPRLDLRHVDLSAQSDPAAEAQLAAFLAQDRAKGVAFGATPPWHVTLVRLPQDRAAMVWTIHHALIDGQSMALVLQDLFAHLDGSPAPAPAAPSLAQYLANRAAKPLSGAKAHFSTLLDGFAAPNALTLPAPDDPSAPSRKAQIRHSLDPALSSALRARAEAAGASLADLIHAAWGLVVARWSGRDEAVIGITRSGRRILPESDGLVGCLITTLPLRMHLPGGRSLDDLLRSLRAAIRALHPVEHASLTDIRAWSGLPATERLFDSLVVFDPESLGARMARLGAAWADRRVELHEEGALPLTLAVHADPALALMLEHDPALVPAARATAMMAQMRRLLQHFATAPPDRALADLPMLSDAELDALRALGRAEAPLPDPLPDLPVAFDAVLHQGGKARALSMVGAAQALDHATLHHRAEALAAALVAAGAGPGRMVALRLPRSPDFVVALLAVLRAGAAFVPVDPDHPEAVAQQMIADSGAALAVAETPVPGLPTLPPDASGPLPLAAPQAGPEDPAYVIFTSGSTGRSKGVVVPRRALLAHSAAIRTAFALSPRDRVLQFASLSFDVSIEEILPSLMAGAEVILRDAAMAASARAFVETTAKLGLTVLNLPTAFWHVLVDEMAEAGLRLPASVRLVIVGGERVNPHSLARWKRLHPDLRLLNGYGPTEATITATLYETPAQPAPGDVPIGRPLPQARVVILAPDGTPAPLGARGALCLGGPCLSLGYVGRPEETAQAFRPDPLGGTGPIYRTGDLAAWRADGALDFFGRQDRQVKLRGFRIDPGQIERVLEQLPGIGQATVQVVKAGTPKARLVAWITPGTGQGGLPDPVALAPALAARLPGHMIPALVPLASLPRTVGGKIDLARLPPPPPPSAADRPAAPADAATARLQRLMAQTLGLPEVGPDDRFHDLGGHSLLAVRLLSRIEADTGRRISLAELHRNPSPRGLAQSLAQSPSQDRTASRPRFIIPIRTEGRATPLFGVHVLGRNEEHFRPLAEALGPDHPVYGLTIGPLTPDTPVGVEATAQLYFEEIQRHHPKGPLCLAALSLAGYFAFDLARQLTEAGREVHSLILLDAAGPGGRAGLRGLGRLRTHGRRLMEDGLRHPLAILSHRAESLRIRLERARLARQGAWGEDGALTIPAFIAANEDAVAQYIARPLAVPLTILRAEENHFDSPECLKSGLGWASVAGAGFTVIDTPGGHLSMLQPPHVATLARHLAPVLCRVPGANGKA